MNNGTFLYPNVTSIPGQSGVSQVENEPKKQKGVESEFDRVFESVAKQGDPIRDLNVVKSPLKFSVHASQRMKDRKIALDPATLSKVSDALDRAESKGIQDTLIVTQDAALIVNVKNRTVVTALDKNSLSGNVFTNIDGAVIL